MPIRLRSNKAIQGSFVTRLCGILSIILGTELIIGWALNSAAMVKILPASNSVSFNTAVALVLAGIALQLPHNLNRIPWRKFISIILIVGASLILYENIFDVALGIDWESLHKVIQDGSPRPGRVAPNTCVAFILVGACLWVSCKPDAAVRQWLVPVCCSLLVATLVTGVTGLMLDPTLLYGWYKFNRMAAPTAFGLSLLTLGVYYEFREYTNQKTNSTGQQEKNILLTGTVILLAMGFAGALNTAIIFANYQQEAIRDKLKSELEGQSRFAQVIIAQAVAETSTLSARPLLTNLIRTVAQRRKPEDVEQLKFTIERLLLQGFSSISLSWEDGDPPLHAGQIVNPVEMSIPLRQPGGDELMWRSQGFFFRAISKIESDSGKVIAIFTTERQLSALTEVYAPELYGQDPAESGICGKLKGNIACFPSKFQPAPWVLPSLGNRPRLPLDDAIDGRSEVVNATDYRGVTSLVAYTPLGDTGLVALSKVDTAFIYQPISHLIGRSLIVLVIFMAIGIVLLRKSLGPLIKAISQSKARADGSERRLKSITDNVPALIGFIDKDLNYRFMNATYERWFGKPLAQMLGKTPQELLGEGRYNIVLPRIQKALSGETVRFTDETPTPRGNYPQFVEVSYIPDFAEDASVAGVNVLAFDVTEQHAHQRELSHLAHHDSLTELPNRRLFDDRIAQALVRAQRHKEPVGLLYLDIDHFKQINDTQGHEVGDMLLRSFAQRLTSAVRDSDTVARLGGDEFVVLMEGLRSPEDALVVAEKILAAIRLPFNLKDATLHVTTSIGMAYTTGPDDTPEQLINRSDASLYSAKTAGRDRVSAYPAASTSQKST